MTVTNVTKNWTRKKDIPENPGTYDVTLGRLMEWRAKKLVKPYAHNRGISGTTTSRVRKLAENFDPELLEQLTYSLEKSNGTPFLETREGNHREQAAWLLYQQGSLTPYLNAVVHIRVVPSTKAMYMYQNLNHKQPHSSKHICTNPQLCIGNVVHTLIGEMVSQFGQEIVSSLIEKKPYRYLGVLGFSMTLLDNPSMLGKIAKIAQSSSGGGRGRNPKPPESISALEYLQVYFQDRNVRKIQDFTPQQFPINVPQKRLAEFLDACEYYFEFLGRILGEENKAVAKNMRPYQSAAWFLFVVCDRLSTQGFPKSPKRFFTQCHRNVLSVAPLVQMLSRGGKDDVLRGEFEIRQRVKAR